MPTDHHDLERYRGYLRVLADMQLNPRIRAKEDVSDVVQTSLLRAHEGLSGFRGSSDHEMKCWLKTILSNVIVNLATKYTSLKRDIRVERSIDEQLQATSVCLAGKLATNEASPCDELIKQELAERLAQALTTLLPDEYVAVSLKHFHGWTIADIAERVGRTETAVSGLLRRGLRKLRKTLEKGEICERW